ncbi:MAG: hypothetical protein HUU36_04880 [Candidatus Omnitrophica bacterium]|nr:hypothetical protein [Candidatus Omnitrophota bacterium]
MLKPFILADREDPKHFVLMDRLTNRIFTLEDFRWGREGTSRGVDREWPGDPEG